MKQEEIDEIGTCFLLLMDNVDYTKDCCTITDMVGAVLPRVILDKANKAKKFILEDRKRLNPR